MIDAVFWGTGFLAWAIIFTAIVIVIGLVVRNAIETTIFLWRMVRVGGWTDDVTWRDKLKTWWEFFIEQPDGYTYLPTGENVFWPGRQAEFEKREREEKERYDRLFRDAEDESHE